MKALTYPPSGGYDVTLWLWVEHLHSKAALCVPKQKTYTVHPPAWSTSDIVGLEMQLNHLARQKYLVEVRAGNNPKIVAAGDAILIQSVMTQWLTPSNSNGDRQLVLYPLAKPPVSIAA